MSFFHMFNVEKYRVYTSHAHDVYPNKKPKKSSKHTKTKHHNPLKYKPTETYNSPCITIIPIGVIINSDTNSLPKVMYP